MGIIQTRSNQYFIEWQIVTLLSSATIRFGGLRHHSQKLAVSPFPVGSNFAAKHISEVLHFFGYVLALAVVFRTRIHENPRDAAQLRMFDWFIWIFCGQCCQMAQHFANHMFAEHHLEFPIGCTISYVAPFSHGYYWPLPRAGQIRCAKFVRWRWLSAHAEERARRHHWEQRNIEVLWPCLITIIHSFYMPLQ